VGNVLVARILFDNFTTASMPTVTSIAKPAGETNNWVFLGAARSTSTSGGAFASGEMWAIKCSVQWPASTNYLVTLSNSVTQKATSLREFTGVDVIMRSTTGTAYSTTTTAASAVTTGTAPLSGDLALGFIFGSNVAAAQAGSNNTTGGSWSAADPIGSTGGSAATNNFGIGQYKVLSAGGHQTYANSAAMTAGNGSIVAVLQQAPAPGTAAAPTNSNAFGAEQLRVTTPASYPANTITWDLWRETNASGFFLIQSGLGLSAVYDDTGLLPTNTYDYLMVSNGSGGAKWGSVSTSVAPTPAPPSFTLTPGSSQITVDITGRNYAAKYKVYRRLTSVGGAYTLVNTSTTQTANAPYQYVDTGLVNGTSYDYVVTTEAQTPTIRESAQSAVQASAPVLTVRPTGTSLAGNFTLTGSTIHGALSDQSDSTYVSGNSTNQGPQVIMSLPAGYVPAAAGRYILTIRRAAVSGTPSVGVRIYKNGTQTFSASTTTSSSTSPGDFSFSDQPNTDLGMMVGSDTVIELYDPVASTTVRIYEVSMTIDVEPVVAKTASDTLSVNVNDAKVSNNSLTYTRVYPAGDIQIGWTAVGDVSNHSANVDDDGNTSDYITSSQAAASQEEFYLSSTPTAVAAWVYTVVYSTSGSVDGGANAFIRNIDNVGFFTLPGTSNSVVTKSRTLNPAEMTNTINPSPASSSVVVYSGDGSIETINVYSIYVDIPTSSTPAGGTSTPITASDTLSAAVTDNGAFSPIAISASDTVSAAIAEGTAIKATVTASDTPTAAVTDSFASFNTQPIAASDTPTAAVTDATFTIKANLTAGDNVNAAVTDVGTFGPVATSTTDTLSAAVTDLAATFATAPAADALTALVTETSGIVISGLITLSASDTLTAAVTEGVNTYATVTASDTLSATLTLESGTFPPVLVPASDTLSASVTDVGVFSTTAVTAVDTNSLGVFDNSAVVITTDAKGASDTLSASVTEAVQFATVSVQASDTLSASVTEATAFAPVAFATSDALSAAVTETVLQIANTPGSDTLTTQLSETSGIVVSGTITVSTSDTLSAAVTDTSAPKASFSATDTLSASLTEGAPGLTFSGTFTVSAFDNTLTSVTETVTTFVPVAVSDTLSASVLDVGTFSTVAVTASDILTTTVNDQGVFSTLPIAASDTLSASVTESRNFSTVNVSANDTLSASVTESVSFGTITVTASDALAAAVTSTVLVQSNTPGLDLLNISVTDTSSVVISGITAKSTTDTVSASVSDIAVIKGIVSANDTLSVSVADNASTFVARSASDSLSAAIASENAQNFISGLMTITAADAPTVTATDIAALNVHSDPTADSLVVTVTETVDIQIGGMVTKSGLESLLASVTDTGAFAPLNVQASDTLSVNVTDSGVFSTVIVTASDNLTITVTESVSFATVNVAASDTLTVALSETDVAVIPGLGSDGLVVLLTDAGNVEVLGLIEVVATDDLTITFDDTADINAVVNIVSVDDLIVYISEAVGKDSRTSREFRGNDWIKGFDRVFRNGAWTSVPRRQ
jgi:hypothetical protein